MARHVFNNAELAHVWANHGVSYGRNASESFSFDGERLYSYRTLIGHCPKPGIGAIEAESFSVTTSNHQSLAIRALDRGFFAPGLDRLVDDPKAWLSDESESHARDLARVFGDPRNVERVDIYFRARGIENAAAIAEKTIIRAEKAAARKANYWIELFHLLLDPAANETVIKRKAAAAARKDFSTAFWRRMVISRVLDYARGRKLPDAADRDNLSWPWRIRQFAIAWRDQHGGKTLPAAMKKGIAIWDASYNAAMDRAKARAEKLAREKAQYSLEHGFVGWSFRLGCDPWQRNSYANNPSTFLSTSGYDPEAMHKFAPKKWETAAHLFTAYRDCAIAQWEIKGGGKIPSYLMHPIEIFWRDIDTFADLGVSADRIATVQKHGRDFLTEQASGIVNTLAAMPSLKYLADPWRGRIEKAMANAAKILRALDEYDRARREYAIQLEKARAYGQIAREWRQIELDREYRRFLNRFPQWSLWAIAFARKDRLAHLRSYDARKLPGRPRNAESAILERHGNTWRINTSAGAKVTIQDAIRLFRAMRKAKESGRAMNNLNVKLGYYTLESIDQDGNAKIGCHMIPFFVASELWDQYCRENPDCESELSK